MTEFNIRNRETLLQNMAAGLNQHDKARVWNLEVVFMRGDDEVVVAPIATALGWIANDIYWDESANWADATHCLVRTF
jgi:hypothetical protein